MLLRKIDYQLRKLRTPAQTLAAAKMSLNNLDDRLARYLNFTNGFFIEAGANDGVNQSNTFFLERCFGWKGVLVEAIPAAYEKCRIHRAGCHVINKALVSRDFSESHVKLHFANLMSVVDGAMEAQEDYIKLGLECQSLPETYAVDVPAATLSDVLRSCRPHPPIDFMSLDVEGYELEVLNGIDAEDWPKWLLVETFKFEEVKRLLGTRYTFVDQFTVHDYLFRRR